MRILFVHQNLTSPGAEARWMIYAHDTIDKADHAATDESSDTAPDSI